MIWNDQFNSFELVSDLWFWNHGRTNLIRTSPSSDIVSVVLQKSKDLENFSTIIIIMLSPTRTGEWSAWTEGRYLVDDVYRLDRQIWITEWAAGHRREIRKCWIHVDLRRQLEMTQYLNLQRKNMFTWKPLHEINMTGGFFSFAALHNLFLPHLFFLLHSWTRYIAPACIATFAKHDSGTSTGLRSGDCEGHMINSMFSLLLWRVRKPLHVGAFPLSRHPSAEVKEKTDLINCQSIYNRNKWCFSFWAL